MTDLAPSIHNIVTSPEFINSVRRYSLLTKDQGLTSDSDIIDIAISDVYPRIITRISLTKDKNGVPLFGGIGVSSEYAFQYEKAMEVVNMEPYSLGIRRVAITLTASTIMRLIPLNSDLKFLDAANKLEEGALEDLDKLIGVLTSDEVTRSRLFGSLENVTITHTALLISTDIDRRTIPYRAFSLVEQDTGGIARYPDAVLYERVSLNEDEIGVCLVMTTALSHKDVLKEAFIIPNGATPIEIATRITETLNEMNIELETGIIAGASKGEPLELDIMMNSLDLYPELPLVRFSDPTSTPPRLLVTLRPSVDVVEVIPQTLSAVRDKEVVTIDLYTIKLSDLPTPLTSLNIINNIHKAKRGLNGIIYGTKKAYRDLTQSGPHSLVIEIEKGNVLLNSEGGSTGGSGASNGSKSTPTLIDTFYFNLQSGVSIIPAYNIRVKVSTALDALSLSEWYVPFEGGSPSDLAKALLMSFYGRKEHNQVLTAIPLNNALQVVPFMLTDVETRIIVDLLDVPPGLDIATGNNINSITPYRPGPRSVTVIAQPFSAKSDSSNTSGTNKGQPIKIGTGYGYASKTPVSEPLRELRQKLHQIESGCESHYSSCQSYTGIRIPPHLYNLLSLYERHQ